MFAHSHGSGAQTEQQLATMSQEMQSMRQYMAQEQQRHAAEIQRHAQEIQRLQDRITMSKPNNWDTLNNYKNFKLFSGDQKEWDEFSTKFRSQVAAGDGGVAALMESVESVMLEEQAERKTGNSWRTINVQWKRCRRSP